MTVTFERLKVFIAEAMTKFGLPEADGTRDGIPIPPALMRSLDQVADDLGMVRLG